MIRCGAIGGNDTQPEQALSLLHFADSLISSYAIPSLTINEDGRTLYGDERFPAATSRKQSRTSKELGYQLRWFSGAMVRNGWRCIVSGYNNTT
jgi:hypothetical protein